MNEPRPDETEIVSMGFAIGRLRLGVEWAVNTYVCSVSGAKPDTKNEQIEDIVSESQVRALVFIDETKTEFTSERTHAGSVAQCPFTSKKKEDFIRGRRSRFMTFCFGDRKTSATVA